MQADWPERVHVFFGNVKKNDNNLGEDIWQDSKCQCRGRNRGHLRCRGCDRTRPLRRWEGDRETSLLHLER